jgi:hypothetical protein
MDHEKVPDLTGAEREAVTAYQEAHLLHASVAMEEVFGDEDEAEERLRRAVERIEEAHARLSELAPQGTPGREEGPSHVELLSLLRELRLGERDAVRPEDPPVPWDKLPEKKLLLFCCLDLMHYSFVTGGALDHVRGRSAKGRLYDLPQGERAAMSEEQIAGQHGDRAELETRLWRLLERAADHGPEERKENMRAFGYDGGYDFRIFLSCYEDDPDYVEGFVEGCLERIAEEEDDGPVHPEDITAEQLLGIWQDLHRSPEERRELVLEALKADCEIREDEGELWRL